LHGRRLRARGHLEAELGADGARARIPLRLDLAQVAEPQSEVSMSGARVDLTIATHARPGLRADGRVRARDISWRGHSLGPIGGAIRIADDRVALDWRSSVLGLEVSIGLVRGDGHADIDVPWSVLRAGDPMHRVLADVAALRLTGHAAGQLHVDLRAPGASRARISVHDATIERVEDRTRARGVYGTMQLAGVEPLESAGEDLVRWSELSLNDVITLGPGSARVRLERSGEVSVRDTVASLGGGRVRAGPLRFDPDAPDLTLDLTFERVAIQQFVHAITRGRASGTGRVDGRIALRLRLGEEPRIVLGSGRLAARGGGRIRVDGATATAPRAPLELARLGNGEWLEDRVLSALRDFRYSRLVLDVVGAEGTKRVVARVSGRGAQTPQAIDLTLNVRGVQPVVDEVLRLWPSNPVNHQ
nr:YdbH domain-containing protein [Myxococcota bacterium]